MTGGDEAKQVAAKRKETSSLSGEEAEQEAEMEAADTRTSKVSTGVRVELTGRAADRDETGGSLMGLEGGLGYSPHKDSKDKDSSKALPRASASLFNGHAKRGRKPTHTQTQTQTETQTQTSANATVNRVDSLVARRTRARHSPADDSSDSRAETAQKVSRDLQFAEQTANDREATSDTDSTDTDTDTDSTDTETETESTDTAADGQPSKVRTLLHVASSLVDWRLWLLSQWSV